MTTNYVTATTGRALWHEIDEERRVRGWRSVFDREADDAAH